jgi:hypothetical protein
MVGQSACGCGGRVRPEPNPRGGRQRFHSLLRLGFACVQQAYCAALQHSSAPIASVTMAAAAAEKSVAAFAALEPGLKHSKVEIALPPLGAS